MCSFTSQFIQQSPEPIHMSELQKHPSNQIAIDFNRTSDVFMDMYSRHQTVKIMKNITA